MDCLVQSQGKGGTAAAVDVESELSKLQGKVQNAEAQYNSQNHKTKQDILEAKQTHNELLDTLLITTIATQVGRWAGWIGWIDGLWGWLVDSCFCFRFCRCLLFDCLDGLFCLVAGRIVSPHRRAAGRDPEHTAQR